MKLGSILSVKIIWIWCTGVCGKRSPHGSMTLFFEMKKCCPTYAIADDNVRMSECVRRMTSLFNMIDDAVGERVYQSVR